MLEACVKHAYDPQEFLSRCRDEGLHITATEAHLNLYRELVQLDKANKNGIWARIIKNNFAPLFVGKVDYVAGNPPWINWESLPGQYREATLPVWDYYKLRPEKGQLGKMLGGKKDISMLFVYCSADNYLRGGGLLGFVITQTVFKTKGAGDGFRQFRLSHENKTSYLKPVMVHDLTRMQVFEGATNRTAVFVCEKTPKKFSYPIPYVMWRGATTLEQDATLSQVLHTVTCDRFVAAPVATERQNSPWLTSLASAMEGLRRAEGKSEYTAREGVNAGGLNGCYWVQILKRLPSGDLLIENCHDVGKTKLSQLQSVVESDLIYPLLRGRDVLPWRAVPSRYIVTPQDPVRQRGGIPEPEMKRKYPKTLAFLKQFEQELTARRDRKYYPAGSPFYTMRNMAAYTLARWKVVWRDMGSEIQVAVVGQWEGKTICPEHHVMFVPLDSADEAHYLCAVLMSAPVQLLVSGYTTATGISTHVLEHCAVPAFKANDSSHRLLARLSEQCHAEASKSNSGAIAPIEKEIDQVAAELWGITENELASIHEAQGDAKSNRRT